MEQEKVEKQFVSGMFVKMPSDKAPDFILLDLSFKPHEFFTWCQDRMDEKGWVNIQVKKSQKGTIYAELNTWKPTKTPEQTQATENYNDTKYQVNNKMAEEMFGTPLTEEENEAMLNIPF